MGGFGGDNSEDRRGREAGGNGKSLECRKAGGDGKDRECRKPVSLSERMRMLAGMVTEGSSVADVGCDHAFLSIYLVQTGKSPKCIAMDVRKGPLSGAEEHIISYGLGEYIETRLSDGLSAYHAGEAQALVCAGMGGRLMERILKEGGEKSRSFSELILQPQSEIPEFRLFLRKAGFLITEEAAVCEEGKYYFAMKAVYKGQQASMAAGLPAAQGWPGGTDGSAGQRSPEKADESAGQKRSEKTELPAAQRRPGETVWPAEPSAEELYDLYGRQLLLDRNPVLEQYLLKRMETVDGIMARLRQKDTLKSEARQRELYLEKEQLERALDFFGKGR